MVKAAARLEPLLRRPFSVFEILRDGDGAPLGISVLSKRIGVTTRQLYDAEPGSACSASGRSAGRSRCVDRDTRPGWSPAASGSRRSPRSPRALRAARRAADALLRRPQRATTCSTWTASSGSASASCSPPRTAVARRARPRHGAARACAAGSRDRRAASCSMRAAPSRCWPRSRDSRRDTAAPCEVSVERVMGCGLGGCYSCVVPVQDRRRRRPPRPLVHRRAGVRRAPRSCGS